MAKYICFLDSLYLFEVNMNDVRAIDEMDISMEKVYVEIKTDENGKEKYTNLAIIEYSVDDNDRLQYDEVYKILVDAYIAHSKQ